MKSNRGGGIEWGRRWNKEVWFDKKKETDRNIHAVIQACPSLLASFSIIKTDAPKSVPLSEELSVTSIYLCTSAGFLTNQQPIYFNNCLCVCV